MPGELRTIVSKRHAPLSDSLRTISMKRLLACSLNFKRLTPYLQYPKCIRGGLGRLTHQSCPQLTSPRRR
jgi:hypothetical protein